jgi:hypothetical protein
MFTAFFAILATSISFLKRFVPLGDFFDDSTIQSDPMVKSSFILGEEKFDSLLMLEDTEVIELPEAEQDTMDFYIRHIIQIPTSRSYALLTSHTIPSLSQDETFMTAQIDTK